MNLRHRATDCFAPQPLSRCPGERVATSLHILVFRDHSQRCKVVYHFSSETPLLRILGELGYVQGILVPSRHWYNITLPSACLALTLIGILTETSGYCGLPHPCRIGSWVGKIYLGQALLAQFITMSNADWFGLLVQLLRFQCHPRSTFPQLEWVVVASRASSSYLW